MELVNPTFYETEGSFTLKDLDGNQVVKGSAGSVGQGGSETLDELLSYKSVNIRQFLKTDTKTQKIYMMVMVGEKHIRLF